MRRPLVILPLLIIFVCAALYIAVIPGREWYSQITQRPRIARYAAALGVGPEQHLVTGTKTNWDSSLVVEYAFYLLPRNTDWSTYDEKLAAFGLAKRGGSHGSGLETPLPWVAGRNGLSISVVPRNYVPISRDVLYAHGHAYSENGRVGVHIVDTRSLKYKFIVDGKDLDDYYVLIIDAGDCQYESDCL